MIDEFDERMLKMAILNRAKTPADAQAMANHLASLDWQQVFLDKAQEEVNYQLQKQIDIQRTIDRGGGYCSNCHDFKHKLYVCPYPDYSTERYCLECITSYLPAKWSIPEDANVTLCDGCDTFYPWREVGMGNVGNHRYYSRCEACASKILARYTKTCPVCDCEHIINGNITSDVCPECKSQDIILQDTRVTSHNLRAKHAKRPATLTLKQWLTTLEYFSNSCAYCGGSYDVLEHFIPVKYAGTTYQNCVPACTSCNSRKGGRRPEKITLPMPGLARVKSYLDSLSTEVVV